MSNEPQHEPRPSFEDVDEEELKQVKTGKKAVCFYTFLTGGIL